MIELAGIPTMTITRQGFSQVVGNAFAAFGFAPEGPSVFEFPIEMFIIGSDLTPLKENIDKVVYGLTKWQPKYNKKGTYYVAEPLVVQGKDYQTALNNMNNMFLQKQWGDGLPLLPATEERVNWILTGTDLPWDKVIGQKILPRGGIATVHDIAVNLAMAGGRPEYLPITIAAVDALTDPGMETYRWNPTTRNVWPTVIVSGPIAEQIRLSSTYGAMGPDSRFPAQGPIGRAVRLMLQNFGGAIPGVGTMAVFGPNRYANSVFGEDESGLPTGWPTFGQDRGFKKGENAVTVIPTESLVNRYLGSNYGKNGLDLLVEMMGVRASPPSNADPNAISGTMLMGRAEAATLAQLGMSKADVRKYIWDKTKFTNNPDQLILVITGGDQSAHVYWMAAGMGRLNVSKAVQTPTQAKWDALLRQAEADLGPAAPQHTGSQ
jgi:hypothetical protein